MERQLEEKEKEFQDLSLHCAQLQLTVLNSNKNEDKHPVETPKKLKKSDDHHNKKCSTKASTSWKLGTRLVPNLQDNPNLTAY